MSRQEHRNDEVNAINMLLTQYFQDYQIDENHVDRPDFVLVKNSERKCKKVGVEIVGLINSKVEESINAHRLNEVNEDTIKQEVRDKKSKRKTKAQKKSENAILSLRPYTYFNETTPVNVSFWRDVLEKKLKLYDEYIGNLNDVVLLIYNVCYKDLESLKQLKIDLNHYFIDNQCKYKSVFLVDFEHNKIIGKIYNRQKPIRFAKHYNEIQSETVVKQFFPANQTCSLWEKYE